MWEKIIELEIVESLQEKQLTILNNFFPLTYEYPICRINFPDIVNFLNNAFSKSFVEDEASHIYALKWLSRYLPEAYKNLFSLQRSIYLYVEAHTMISPVQKMDLEDFIKILDFTQCISGPYTLPKKEDKEDKEIKFVTLERLITDYITALKTVYNKSLLELTDIMMPHNTDLQQLIIRCQSHPSLVVIMQRNININFNTTPEKINTLLEMIFQSKAFSTKNIPPLKKLQGSLNGEKLELYPKTVAAISSYFEFNQKHGSMYTNSDIIRILNTITKKPLPLLKITKHVYSLVDDEHCLLEIRSHSLHETTQPILAEIRYIKESFKKREATTTAAFCWLTKDCFIKQQVMDFLGNFFIQFELLNNSTNKKTPTNLKMLSFYLNIFPAAAYSFDDDDVELMKKVTDLALGFLNYYDRIKFLLENKSIRILVFFISLKVFSHEQLMKLMELLLEAASETGIDWTNEEELLEIYGLWVKELSSKSEKSRESSIEKIQDIASKTANTILVDLLPAKLREAKPQPKLGSSSGLFPIQQATSPVQSNKWELFEQSTISLARSSTEDDSSGTEKKMPVSYPQSLFGVQPQRISPLLNMMNSKIQEFSAGEKESGNEYIATTLKIFITRHINDLTHFKENPPLLIIQTIHLLHWLIFTLNNKLNKECPKSILEKVKNFIGSLYVEINQWVKKDSRHPPLLFILQYFFAFNNSSYNVLNYALDVTTPSESFITIKNTDLAAILAECGELKNKVDLNFRTEDAKEATYTKIIFVALNHGKFINKLLRAQPKNYFSDSSLYVLSGDCSQHPSFKEINRNALSPLSHNQ